MRIHVQDGKRNIRFWFPTGFIFSSITAEIAALTMRKYVNDPHVNLSSEQLRVLFAEMRRIKQRHGSWELVNVEGAKGEVIQVII